MLSPQAFAVYAGLLAYRDIQYQFLFTMANARAIGDASPETLAKLDSVLNLWFVLNYYQKEVVEANRMFNGLFPY